MQLFPQCALHTGHLIMKLNDNGAAVSCLGNIFITFV